MVVEGGGGGSGLIRSPVVVGGSGLTARSSVVTAGCGFEGKPVVTSASAVGSGTACLSVTGGSVFLAVSGAGSCRSVFCVEGAAVAFEPSVFTASVSEPVTVISVSVAVTVSNVTSETVSVPVAYVISVSVYTGAPVVTYSEIPAVSETG